MDSGKNIAGESYILLCTANVPPDTDVNLEWFGPNGAINMSTITIHLMSTESSSSSGIQYNSSITFSPLQVSHNGTYTCSVPSIRDSSSKNVIVKGMQHKRKKIN